MLRTYQFCVPRCVTAATIARCPGGDRAAACAPVLSQRRWASDSTPSGPPAPTAPVDGGVPSAAASGAAFGAAGTLADGVFEHDVHLSANDLVPANQPLTDRFVGTTFTVYATPQRRHMACRVLARSGQLLTGAQGFGKSFFAAGLVHELRRLEPHVPVMYLPYANFGPVEAAEALRFALEKAEGCPPVPALEDPVTDLNVVVAAMQTVTRVHKKQLRLVIDQMNTAFRVTPPNHNYAELIDCATWFLLVTSHSTSTKKLAYDMPSIDYGALPLDESIGCAMITRVLSERLHGSAPLLYERTGGNPLELSLLVAHLGKQECKTDAQLEAAVKWWFGERVNAVHTKLTADGPSHTRQIIRGCSYGLGDPRFFANGVALFPAVEAAMRKVLETHPDCVPVDLASKFLRPEVYVRVYGLPGVPKKGAVINVGSTLKQEGLRLTVDGLKKAVMRKLANSLVGTGIGITRLQVYPAAPERGTEPYTWMSTQLAAAREESPYHVVVPPF